MMLAKLSDKDLITATDRAVAKEREILFAVLQHLHEIQRRRLFSHLGYSSLWQYAVKRLKYSDDQAYRRIAAMRLMQKLPEVRESIADGALSLSNIGLAERLFRRQPMPRKAKIALLKRMEHLSRREAERVIVEHSSPTVLIPDQISQVTETEVLLQFTANQSLVGKLEQLKGLLAHSHPQLKLGDLIHLLADIGLAKLRGKPPAPERVKSDTPGRRYVSAALRREVWHRAGHRCTNCGSQHALQIEHIVPLGRGGRNSPENLTLLCRSCNQRTAINQYGLPKMEKFLVPDSS